MWIHGAYLIDEIIDKYEEETDELIDKCFESALDEACNIEDHEQSVQNESMLWYFRWILVQTMLLKSSRLL